MKIEKIKRKRFWIVGLTIHGKLIDDFVTARSKAEALDFFVEKYECTLIDWRMKLISE